MATINQGTPENGSSLCKCRGQLNFNIVHLLIILLNIFSFLCLVPLPYQISLQRSMVTQDSYMFISWFYNILGFVNVQVPKTNKCCYRGLKWVWFEFFLILEKASSVRAQMDYTSYITSNT